MLNNSILDLPPVKPSAIALGTVFNHAASLAVLGPVFGDTYHRAQAANSKEEFIKSKEAASAAAAWGTSLVGSAIQSYSVGALINATGTLSYKGAAYLGSLIFMASSAPSVSLIPKFPLRYTRLTKIVHRPSRHRKETPRHRGSRCFGPYL
jgi:hypothetical protein